MMSIHLMPPTPRGRAAAVTTSESAAGSDPPPHTRKKSESPTHLNGREVCSYFHTDSLQ
jgi:hypothetical protein